jgi:hypothetical protein
MNRGTIILLALVLMVSFFSCDDDKKDPATTLVELKYPKSTNTINDSKTSVLGYGFDATGFSDVGSVKELIAVFPENYCIFQKVNESGSRTEADLSLFHLQEQFELHPDITTNNVDFVSHVSSLLELANNVNESTSVVYYESYYSRRRIRYAGAESANLIIPSLTHNFKRDIDLLSPKELVERYGTHIINSLRIGTKFQVVYTCETEDDAREYDLRQQFLKRLGEMMGGTPYVVPSKYKIESKYWNEKMVFNTIGSKVKQCGLIEITNNNPDKIKMDYNSVYGDNIIDEVIDINMIISIDQLISDPDKKKEVKAYLENYLISNIELITQDGK